MFDNATTYFALLIEITVGVLFAYAHSMRDDLKRQCLQWYYFSIVYQLGPIKRWGKEYIRM